MHPMNIRFENGVSMEWSTLSTQYDVGVMEKRIGLLFAIAFWLGQWHCLF
ncbi:hypothetical protein AF72_11080 [Xylella taiwanensis]|uniref:Uncharacterized protein n=1 Tax=Xylella taiwanensis TaxID=1444770 RepID=Z9JHV1_9GAMM|nr:hypothetical protein AF72_11080 [Xylella taiwanensis]